MLQAVCSSLPALYYKQGYTQSVRGLHCRHVAGLSECSYRAMPRVEQTLASYLSPGAASSLKALQATANTTSVLLGKGYTAVGQGGECLHTMSVLQVYQADLLKELDEGEEVKSDDISELRRTADLSLCTTKELARAMAAMVAAERHLWLTLSDMKDPPLHLLAFSVTASISSSTSYPEAHKQVSSTIG